MERQQATKVAVVMGIVGGVLALIGFGLIFSVLYEVFQRSRNVPAV